MISKTFNVNYLLAMARLPDHFYAMMENLSGRDAIYQNPGVSLRSFVIARCIRKEVVELYGEMLKTAILCEEFSRSPKVLAYITERLRKDSLKLCDHIDQLIPEAKIDYAMFILPLEEFSQVLKLSFDSFIMTQDPSSNRVDISSQQGINLKSAMIDLKELIEDVQAHVDAAGKA